jgi:beta-glucanase (GH16 family)
MDLHSWLRFSILFSLILSKIIYSQNLELVFSDEFSDDGSLDTQKWAFESGFVRNGEEQYYTTEGVKNCQVKNGNLYITLVKERYPNSNYDPSSDNYRLNRQYANYTSASVTTKESIHIAHGRVDVNCALPTVQGVWPAIWLLGVRRNIIEWPYCGEIDIMEYFGNRPNKIMSNIHHGDEKGNHSQKKGLLSVSNNRLEQFNEYSLVWSADELSFLFNNVEYHRIDINKLNYFESINPYDFPHYLIINLAFGGGSGGAVDGKGLPQSMAIDYVRIYEYKN